MSRVVAAAVAALVVAPLIAPSSVRLGPLAPAVAHAGDDYFAAATPNQIKVRKSRSRTLGQQLAIGGLVAGGVVAAGAGVYFTLDARDASDAVSTDADRPIGAWTPDRQDAYDRAGASSTAAVALYAVGAALLGAAVWTTVATRPGDDEAIVGGRAGAPVIAPVRGGAVVAGEWRW